MTVDTKSKALRQAAALLRLAQSDNAHEAAAAMARAQEIMARHEISEAMLALDGAPEEPDEPFVDFGGRPGGDLYVATRTNMWRLRLAAVIARANGCKAYGRGGSIQLIGRPSDVDTVRYLFGYLASEVERLTKRDGAGMGLQWRNNFAAGVIDALCTALMVMRERVADEMRAKAASPAALVKVDQALAAPARKLEALDAWMHSAGVRFSKARSGGARNPSAREAGRKAGETIKIGGARRALGAGAESLR